MFCKNCGSAIEEMANVCSNCGAPVNGQVPVTACAPPVKQEAVIPEQNRPVSAWGYFGLQILFAIPVVGFIFLLVFSFNNGNINRRNFARSYWCGLLIVVIVVVIAMLLGLSATSLFTNIAGGAY